MLMNLLMFPEGIHFVPIFCFFYVFVDIAVVIHNEEFQLCVEKCVHLMFMMSGFQL